MPDSSDPVSDLSAHELDAAYRRLVVEQDAGARKHSIALAKLIATQCAKSLAWRTSWMKRRRL